MVESAIPRSGVPGNPETQAPKQGARAVFLVRPSAFGFNPETAPSNAFQHPPPSGRNPARLARSEFDRMAHDLRGAGLRVIVVEDTRDPPKPDAVFPNNWMSTHEDGTLVLYPMQAPNRRRERRPAIATELGGEFQVRRVIDLTPHEREGRYLEGTGSLVLDRVGRMAYAARSVRTDSELVRAWGETLGYRVELFDASDLGGMPVYHTNVLMAIGSHWAVLGTELIQNQSERQRILSRLRDTGHEVLELATGQVLDFAGNLLELAGPEGALIVVSRRGLRALGRRGAGFLETHGQILEVDLDVIETVGGGGVRCMLAEIFLPPRDDPTPGAGTLP